MALVLRPIGRANIADEINFRVAGDDGDRFVLFVIPRMTYADARGPGRNIGAAFIRDHVAVTIACHHAYERWKARNRRRRIAVEAIRVGVTRADFADIP